MRRLPPRPTRSATPFPSTLLFRSGVPENARPLRSLRPAAHDDRHGGGGFSPHPGHFGAPAVPDARAPAADDEKRHFGPPPRPSAQHLPVRPHDPLRGDGI